MSNIINKIVSPFLLVPLFMFGQTKSVDSEEPNNKPSQNVSQASKLLNFSKGFFKLPKLTQEENKILDEMEGFLTKYTGNGKLNYGTIPRIIEGLKCDYKAISEEAESVRGFRRIAALRYPNNISRLVYRKVQREIEDKAYIELVNKLRFFEIDPDTANERDDAPITNLVTKDALDRFEQNSYILDNMSKKYLPASKKVIFPKGITIEAIRFIRSRELGLPPGGEIVDKE